MRGGPRKFGERGTSVTNFYGHFPPSFYPLALVISSRIIIITIRKNLTYHQCPSTFNKRLGHMVMGIAEDVHVDLPKLFRFYTYQLRRN
jgi:hypothetical protein